MRDSFREFQENEPDNGVCCNACRTCVTTKIAGLVAGAVGGAALAVTSFARRRFANPA
jgi:hypothetical protein